MGGQLTGVSKEGRQLLTVSLYEVAGSVAWHRRIVGHVVVARAARPLRQLERPKAGLPGHADAFRFPCHLCSSF